MAWANRFKGAGTNHIAPGAKTAVKGNSASSLNKAIDTLRRVTDIALESGQIHSNPANAKTGEGRLKKKVEKKKLILPSVAEVQKNFLALEQNGSRGGWGIEAADFCRFMAFSGCRIGEVPTVNWSYVNWDKRRLHVHGYKSKTSDRDIPLFPDLEVLLTKVSSDEKKLRSTLWLGSHFSSHATLFSESVNAKRRWIRHAPQLASQE
jgi:integrase